MSAMQGYGRGDGLGTWAPVGGSSGEKDLIRLPSEAEKLAPLAGTFVRARIREKLRGHYGLAASLIGDYKPGQAFIINMMSTGLGEGGFARNEYLMALARMLVPSAMPMQSRFGGDGQGKPHDHAKQQKNTGTDKDE